MWASIKSGIASLWAMGKAWISKPENQKTAIDAGKQLIEQVKGKK